VTKAFFDSAGSLEARLEALRAVASLVEWPQTRERDPRVCAEYAGLLDKLLAMLGQGPGALDVALGEGLRELAACEGALKAGHSGNGDFAREELGIAARHADFDVPVRKLVGQFRGGFAEDVHQAEPEGWLQGCRDSTRSVGNRLVAHCGDGFQILLECLDEGRHVHGRHYDITMMSRQVFDGVIQAPS